MIDLTEAKIGARGVVSYARPLIFAVRPRHNGPWGMKQGNERPETMRLSWSSLSPSRLCIHPLV
jgi:hypothetical protein